MAPTTKASSFTYLKAGFVSQSATIFHPKVKNGVLNCHPSLPNGQQYAWRINWYICGLYLMVQSLLLWIRLSWPLHLYSPLRHLSSLCTGTFLPAYGAFHLNWFGITCFCQGLPMSMPQRALDPSYPDWHIWVSSYKEEKTSLFDVDTSKVIMLDTYQCLCHDGGNPSMCILVIKTDEHGQPDCAKSCIVVLGNLESCTWGKHESAAPVKKYSSLHLMMSAAVERRCKLKQADYKNAFCNPTLLDDEPPLSAHS